MNAFIDEFQSAAQTLFNQSGGMGLMITVVLALLLGAVVLKAAMNALESGSPGFVGSLGVMALGVTVLLALTAGLRVGLDGVVGNWSPLAVLGLAAAVGVLVLVAPLTNFLLKGKYFRTTISWAAGLASMVIAVLLSGAILEAVGSSDSVVDKQQQRKKAIEQF